MSGTMRVLRGEGKILSFRLGLGTHKSPRMCFLKCSFLGIVPFSLQTYELKRQNISSAHSQHTVMGLAQNHYNGHCHSKGGAIEAHRHHRSVAILKSSWTCFQFLDERISHLILWELFAMALGSMLCILDLFVFHRKQPTFAAK